MGSKGMLPLKTISLMVGGRVLSGGMANRWRI